MIRIACEGTHGPRDATDRSRADWDMPVMCHVGPARIARVLRQR